VHCVLGDALATQRAADEALTEYGRAVALDANYAPAFYGQGRVFEERGDEGAAIAAWRNALGANPDYAEAHLALAHALAARGETAEALEQWRTGLAQRPHDGLALREAAWVLATSADASLRSGPEALALAVRALQLNGRCEARSRPAEACAALLDTLAAAYAECRRFADAVATARRALAVAAATEAAGIRQRIALYERQAPYHGTSNRAE